MIRNLTVGYVTETNEDGLEFAVLATFRCAFSENHNFLLSVHNYIKSIEPMFPTKQIIALHRDVPKKTKRNRHFYTGANQIPRSRRTRAGRVWKDPPRFHPVNQLKNISKQR
jgi:hypothetical protein